MENYQEYMNSPVSLGQNSRNSLNESLKRDWYLKEVISGV